LWNKNRGIIFATPDTFVFGWKRCDLQFTFNYMQFSRKQIRFLMLKYKYVQF